VKDYSCDFGFVGLLVVLFTALTISFTALHVAFNEDEQNHSLMSINHVSVRIRTDESAEELNNNQNYNHLRNRFSNNREDSHHLGALLPPSFSRREALNPVDPPIIRRNAIVSLYPFTEDNFL
jgi:hypothetical protein